MKHGIQFPALKGARSSTAFAKSILASAAVAVGDDAGAQAVDGEKKWRANYHRHFVRHGRQSSATAEAAVAMARAALDALHNTLELGGEGGTSSLRAAVRAGIADTAAGTPPPRFGAAIIRGAADAPARLEVPAALQCGRTLYGAFLTGQCDKWARAGVCEPTAAAAIRQVVDNADAWCDLRGQHFCIIGAGSQMGPARTLLSLGATVLALDLGPGRPAGWQRLVAHARATAGTLVVPVPANIRDVDGASPQNDARVCEAAGVDLMRDAPAAARWVLAHAPHGGARLAIGSFVYLDGGAFVKVAAAADAVIEAVCAARGDPARTAVCSLCSPTEVHFPPLEARAAARAAFASRPLPGALWEGPLRTLSRGRYLAANDAEEVGSGLLMQDSVVWQQGPNYCLAKMVQRWRAVVALMSGHVVSANVAPATLTESVVHNKLVAAGMKGCAGFGVEAFEVATSSSLMCALLIRDLRDPSAFGAGGGKGQHPLRLFAEGAVHGGTWRAPFKTNTYTEVSALVYAGEQAKPYVVAAGGAAALAVAWKRSKL